MVQNPEPKERLREAANNQAQVSSAPAVIVIYSHMKDTLSRVEEIFHPGFPEEQKITRAAKTRKTWETRSDQDRETFGKGQVFILLGHLMLIARAYGYEACRWAVSMLPRSRNCWVCPSTWLSLPSCPLARPTRKAAYITGIN